MTAQACAPYLQATGQVLAVVGTGDLNPGVLHEPRVVLTRGCPYSTRDTDPRGVHPPPSQ